MPSGLSRFEGEGPGIAGPLCLAVLLGVVMSVVNGPPALAHGEALDVVVEVVNPSDDPAQLAYGIFLSFADGHEATGATVTVTAQSETGETIDVVAAETTPGAYIAELTLEQGRWRVRVDIEADEAQGSVEFTEEVGEALLTRPLVRVDTADPDREGEEASDSPLVSPTEPTEAGQETGLTLRVEALVRDAVAPLVVEYGVVAESSVDSVSLSAVSDRSVGLRPVSLAKVAPGVFQVMVEYPEAGQWEVTVEAAGDGGGVTSFAEALPWPHYTTEAGSPKLKVNTEDHSLEGTVIDLVDSPIFGLDRVTTTSPGPADTPTTGAEGDDVVVSFPTSGAEIAFQVTLRWLHLAGIGAWGASIAAVGLGRSRRLWTGLGLGAMIAVVVTGVALSLWGAPTPFPGIWSWSELGARRYGASYQWAFLIKMALVLTAVLATVLLVARRSRARLAVAALGMLGALAAVVVMAQLHIFAHL